MMRAIFASTALALSSLLLLGAAPIARAQDLPPRESPVTCDYSITPHDQRRVQICSLANRDTLVMLAEPNISEQPLLYMTLHDGLTLWAPIAQRYLPQAWATLPGDIFTVIHPRTPPCPGPGDQTTMYYYEFGDGWGIYATPDGYVGCFRPGQTEERREQDGPVPSSHAAVP
jgi:hypothetical protein